MSEWIEGIEFSVCIKNPNFICVDTHDFEKQCPCEYFKEEPNESSS